MVAFTRQDVNVREYEGFEIRRKDPFGHWEVRPKTGPLPSALNQVFTETRHAVNAIDTYVRSRPKKAEKVEKVKGE